MEDAKPWLGHGKERKHHQVRRKTGDISDNKGVNVEDKDIASSNDVPDTTVTRRGRVVRKLLWFQVNRSSCPKDHLYNKGAVVKAKKRVA